jgi:hypothetical protein
MTKRREFGGGHRTARKGRREKGLIRVRFASALVLLVVAAECRELCEVVPLMRTEEGAGGRFSGMLLAGGAQKRSGGAVRASRTL